MNELPPIPDRLPATIADMGQFLMSRNNSQQGHIVLRLDGHLDAARLNRAMRLIADVEPILGCRFVEHWYRPYWQRRDDLDSVAFCEMVECDDLQAALNRYMTTQKDPRTDLVIQSRLFRSSDKEILCYKVNHICGDAPAFFKIVLDYADVYRRLQNEPGYVPPREPIDRSFKPILKRLGWRHQFRVFRHFLKDRTKPVGFWVFPDEDGAGGTEEAEYLFRSVPAEHIKAAASLAHRHRTTITCVLITAMYRTMRSLFEVSAQDGKVIVGTSVDQRNYLPALERKKCHLANYSGITRVTLDQPANAEFEIVLTDVKTQFKAEYDQKIMGLNYPSLILSFPWMAPLRACLPFAFIQKRIAQAIQSRAGSNLRVAGIVNAGEIDPQAVDFGDVKIVHAMGTPSIYRRFGFAIGTSFFQGEGTLSIGIADTLMRRETAERILTGLQNQFCQIADLIDQQRPVPATSTDRSASDSKTT